MYAHLRLEHSKILDHSRPSLLEQHQLERLAGFVERCDDSPERDEVKGGTVLLNFRRLALRALLIWVLIVGRAVVPVIAVVVTDRVVLGPALLATA